jgi:hypothetical protein
VRKSFVEVAVAMISDDNGPVVVFVEVCDVGEGFAMDVRVILLLRKCFAAIVDAMKSDPIGCTGAE